MIQGRLRREEPRVRRRGGGGRWTRSASPLATGSPTFKLLTGPGPRAGPDSDSDSDALPP
eukprot:3215349-Rhodomonas_salina.1